MTADPDRRPSAAAILALILGPILVAALLTVAVVGARPTPEAMAGSSSPSELLAGDAPALCAFLLEAQEPVREAVLGGHGAGAAADLLEQVDLSGASTDGVPRQVRRALRQLVEEWSTAIESLRALPPDSLVADTVLAPEFTEPLLDVVTYGIDNCGLVLGAS